MAETITTQPAIQNIQKDITNEFSNIIGILTSAEKRSDFKKALYISPLGPGLATAKLIKWSIVAIFIVLIIVFILLLTVSGLHSLWKIFVIAPALLISVALIPLLLSLSKLLSFGLI